MRRFSKFRAQRSGPLVQCKNGQLREKYASRREHGRAVELQIMERAGLISELQEQVVFQLIPQVGEERPASYVADFVYTDEHGNKVVEDCKGFKTKEYLLKRKLMRWIYGIAIRES